MPHCGVRLANPPFLPFSSVPNITSFLALLSFLLLLSFHQLPITNCILREFDFFISFHMAGKQLGPLYASSPHAFV